jgi:6-phospho-3-hexuloisomerase
MVEEKEDVKETMQAIISHIIDVMNDLKDEDMRDVIDSVLSAKRIFLMGAGRSGLVAKAFAMRLMHLGFDVFVVGESTTPALKSDDLVIAISGSGETISVTNLAKVSKDIDSKLVAFTSNPDSTLGKLADVIAVVKGGRKSGIDEDYLERQMRGEYVSIAPLGTLFEITSLIILDAIISELMSLTGKSEADLNSRHATLE